MQTHSIRWTSLEAAKGAEHSHCKAMLCHPWKVMANKGGSLSTEKTKYYTHLQDDQEGRPKHQSNISPQNCKQTCLEALARQMYDRRVIGKS